MKDDRLAQLDTLSQFQSHSAILTKMYMNQLIRTDSKDWIQFEQTLTESQRAMTGDFGLTYAGRAIMEHNMVALSQIYSNIKFQQMEILLGYAHAEQMAAKMITEDKLPNGTCMDQVEQLLIFGNDNNTNNIHANHTMRPNESHRSEERLVRSLPNESHRSEERRVVSRT